jgi:hypothetical protein
VLTSAMLLAQACTTKSRLSRRDGFWECDLSSMTALVALARPPPRQLCGRNQVRSYFQLHLTLFLVTT